MSKSEIDALTAEFFGAYEKSGTLNGHPYGGSGTKTFQFVRTPEGWRIAAFSWFDQP